MTDVRLTAEPFRGDKPLQLAYAARGLGIKLDAGHRPFGETDRTLSAPAYERRRQITYIGRVADPRHLRFILLVRPFKKGIQVRARLECRKFHELWPTSSVLDH